MEKRGEEEFLPDRIKMNESPFTIKSSTVS